MTDEPVLDEKEQFALRALFGRQVPPVPDAGFSTTVASRLRRRMWKRRIVLLAASAFGLAIALPMIGGLLAMGGNMLVELAGRAEQSDALGQFHTLLSMLPLQEAAQAAGDELKTLGAQVNGASWVKQNMTLVLASLLAAVSFITTRLLDE